MPSDSLETTGDPTPGQPTNDSADETPLAPRSDCVSQVCSATDTSKALTVAEPAHPTTNKETTADSIVATTDTATVDPDQCISSVHDTSNDITETAIDEGQVDNASTAAADEAPAKEDEAPPAPEPPTNPALLLMLQDLR
jgi:hypothetical protein